MPRWIGAGRVGSLKGEGPHDLAMPVRRGQVTVRVATTSSARPDVLPSAMLNFALTSRDGFNLAHLDGLVSLEAWDAVLKSLDSALAASPAPNRLVIDMTGVLGYLGVPERRAVGALMAQHFAGMAKVALVVQAHKITDVVYTEAQKNGLNLQLFPRYEDAAQWVKS
jgi:hypothetical protein